MEERPTRASRRLSCATAPSTANQVPPALPLIAAISNGHMRQPHAMPTHTAVTEHAPHLACGSFHCRGSAWGPDDSDNPIAHCTSQHKALYANVDKQWIGRKEFATDSGVNTAHQGMPPRHGSSRLDMGGPHNEGCRHKMGRVAIAGDAATPWAAAEARDIATAWDVATAWNGATAWDGATACDGATSSDAVEDVPPTVSRLGGRAALRQPASSTLAPAAEPRATR